ncbi:prolyl 4-hydroxylase subunit alpha-1 [Drosophila eugracilis]|uniref:prolyl 4-hydroxylase subunit alpha-1 n=1 Tax=Drosophila eugracilis TaxID=29029 RepID=UPI0007E63E4F|nr:prolyl 4-hydroxylase subunit alpha-1 [Drosophila eugracilis]
MVNVKLMFLRMLFLALVLGEVSRERILEQRHTRSVVNMDHMLLLDSHLAENLENFAAALSQKANTIIWGIHQMVERYQNYGKHWQNSVGPFYSYSLIRHMQADWLMWKEYLEKPVGQEYLAYMESQRTNLPKDCDLLDATEGMRKIQVTYRMLATDVAKGLLDGVQYNSSLAPVDCLAMGEYLMNESRWKGAEQWILAGIAAEAHQTALHLLRGPSDAELYRRLGQVRMEQGNHKGALEAYQVALKHSPHDSKVFEEYRTLEGRILTLKAFKPIEEEEDDSYEDNILPPCCSGRCEVSRKLRRLYCVYNHVTSPFLLLAPIKTEILSIDPFVMLLHNMVSPQDSAQLRSSSKQDLQPSTIANIIDKNFTIEVADYRTSKSVWYSNSFSEATKNTVERLGDATGLDMNYTEHFQIINYGLGGFFTTHFDLVLKDEDRFNGSSDRLATTLFYLNDVPQGGGTHFPKLNITVFPKSGSALFWYNLRNSGSTHNGTLHTGCPVIVGSKWVVSKWITDEGQEFRRPCIDSKSKKKYFPSVEKVII